MKNKFVNLSILMACLFSACFFNIQSAQAHGGRGLAITGVALGGSALALAGYNTYQIRRNNNYYRPPVDRYRRPAPRHYRESYYCPQYQRNNYAYSNYYY